MNLEMSLEELLNEVGYRGRDSYYLDSVGLHKDAIEVLKLYLK